MLHLFYGKYLSKIPYFLNFFFSVFTDQHSPPNISTLDGKTNQEKLYVFVFQIIKFNLHYVQVFNYIFTCFLIKAENKTVHC